MGDILLAVVAIGGPILIAAAVVFGLLAHSRGPRRDPAINDGSIASIVQAPDRQDDPSL